MKKSNTSAVVIIPPKKIWTPIQEIRKRYDRHINNWMPHITLIYPFVSEDEYSSIEKEFSDKCSEIKQFEITLNSFHSFNHKRQQYTMWLNPEPINLIQKLQAQILRIVPKFNDVNKYKNGFIPHLSVGQIVGKNNLNNVINDLQNNWTTLTWQIRKICFISRKKSKTSRFEIVKQLNFKQNN